MHFIKYLFNKFGSFIVVNKKKIKVFILKNIYPNKSIKAIFKKMNDIIGNFDLLSFQTKDDINNKVIVEYHDKKFVIYEKEFIVFKNKTAFIKYFCMEDFYKREATIYKQVISEQEFNNLSLPRKTDEDIIETKCFLKSVVGISYSSIGYSGDSGPTHIFLIPYVEGVKYNFFILCELRVYQIIFIENVNELNIMLSLECIKRVEL